ncbi:MAG: hypothetical protein IKH06_00390 [Clostridiales bacterium]|nr:hypothetical protein [Clostridiales bacterium]
MATIPGWLGDGDKADGGLGNVENKILHTSGNIVAVFRGISIAVALVALAFGLLLLATGSQRRKEEGKDRMIGAIIALFATGAVFAVLFAVFSAF